MDDELKEYLKLYRYKVRYVLVGSKIWYLDPKRIVYVEREPIIYEKYIEKYGLDKRKFLSLFRHFKHLTS